VVVGGQVDPESTLSCFGSQAKKGKDSAGRARDEMIVEHRFESGSCGRVRGKVKSNKGHADAVGLCGTEILVCGRGWLC
jgi:hypothetical protein